MCQQVQVNNTKNNNNNNNKMKQSYSIKKVLKALFKKHHRTVSNSLESLENLRNSQMEQHLYEEIEDNSANEKLTDIIQEQHDIYVPVRFARTEAGTFFWTTNLQPVTSTIMPVADGDLLQPAYCYSNCQFQDRWAQA